jgi:hypothetical protein
MRFDSDRASHELKLFATSDLERPVPATTDTQLQEASVGIQSKADISQHPRLTP